MIEQLDHLEVITLFVEDLARARAFYKDVFNVMVVFEDESCLVVKLANIMLNLLRATQAPDLVTPASVGGPKAGTRALLTIAVADVDVVCAQLRDHGVELLNGPVDRPWGRRTAAFSDPAGHVWEVAQVLKRP